MRQASAVLALLAGFAGLLVQDALAQGKPPMPFRVQIVYSPRYAVDLGGLEKLHPFDIRKYEKIYKQLQADIVFIVGGCDTLSGDPLASLEMTPEGIVTRDAMIVASCVEKNIPVVFTLSGGYSQDAWRTQYQSISQLIETYGVAN